MTKKYEKSRITLLVHSKIAVFDWGKTYMELFAVQAAKNKHVLITVYDVDKITDFGSPVVLLGVESAWLDNAIEKLRSKRSKIILLHGITLKNYEYINHIATDQRIITAKCLELLRKQGRTHTAFFGEQKNDTSDRIKTLAFCEQFSGDDVYTVENSVEECFERLLKNLDRYDSIVCANDVMAIYLLSRFRAMGIPIPERLQLIGNANMWLGAHVTPSLTTVSCNSEAVVKLAFQLCKTLCEFENIGSVNISMSVQIIPRRSTGNEQDKTDEENGIYYKRGAVADQNNENLSRELSEIVLIDKVFSACTEKQISVLRCWIAGDTVDRISEKVFISRDTVKYQLKNLYKQLNIHSKNELMELVNKYGLSF